MIPVRLRDNRPAPTAPAQMAAILDPEKKSEKVPSDDWRSEADASSENAREAVWP